MAAKISGARPATNYAGLVLDMHNFVVRQEAAFVKNRQAGVALWVLAVQTVGSWPC